MAKHSDRRNFSPLEEALIEGYLNQTGQTRPGVHWTWGLLDGLVTHAPNRAWPLLVEMSRRATDTQLGAIGAGPLEDLLGSHGEKVISAVERQAAVDPRFRLALAGTWQGQMRPEVYARVRAAAPEELWRPIEEAKAADRTPRPARHIEIWNQGLPPGVSSNADIEAAAMEGLAAEVAALPKHLIVPFDSPVSLELRVEVAVGSPVVQPAHMLDGLVRALVRPEIGLLTEQTLVWQLVYSRNGGNEDSYQLELTRMPEEQVAAMDDRSDFEPALPDLGAWLASLPEEDRKLLEDRQRQIDEAPFEVS